MSEFDITPANLTPAEQIQRFADVPDVQKDRHAYDTLAAKVAEQSAIIEGLRNQIAEQDTQHENFQTLVRDRLKDFAEEHGVERSDLNDLLSDFDLDPFQTRVTATISINVEVEFLSDKDESDIDDDHILTATALQVTAGYYSTAEDLEINENDWTVETFEVTEE